MPNLPRALGVHDLVDILRSKGRGEDSMLAHINPREAHILRLLGGSGDTNPHTGITEFDDTLNFNPMDSGGANFNPQIDAPQNNGLTTGYFSGDSAPAPNYSLNVDAPTPGLTSSYSPGNVDLSGGGAGGGSAGSSDTPLNFSSMSGSAPQGLTPSFNPGPIPGASTPAAASGDNSGLGGLLTSGENFAKNNKNLLSLAGSLGLGAYNMRKATQQGAAAESRIKKLAAPYRTQANAALAGAASGNLTPAMQQQLQGLRANAAQNLSAAGQESGTAAQQAEANIQQQAALFQQNLMQQGLQLAGVADQLTLEAINAGYQSDQAAQKAANGFYTAIFEAIGKAGK